MCSGGISGSRSRAILSRLRRASVASASLSMLILALHSLQVIHRTTKPLTSIQRYNHAGESARFHWMECAMLTYPLNRSVLRHHVIRHFPEAAYVLLLIH